jgi:hypothetical protein
MAELWSVICSHSHRGRRCSCALEVGRGSGARAERRSTAESCGRLTSMVWGAAPSSAARSAVRATSARCTRKPWVASRVARRGRCHWRLLQLRAYNSPAIGDPGGSPGVPAHQPGLLEDPRQDRRQARLGSGARRDARFWAAHPGCGCGSIPVCALPGAVARSGLRGDLPARPDTLDTLGLQTRDVWGQYTSQGTALLLVAMPARRMRAGPQLGCGRAPANRAAEGADCCV